ncbi:MAG: 2-C-methyl-D-erythritol 4-phosphate cytidylyltransferase [Desulfobacteraceae bacterium]|nr:2-C-methyl-D-erythritol 4-phosphate cytidylyltransferase [Desulfobacteraceae bacterium]MBL7172364.1 2-C-methyl-D-erythritol 4-phosphate cytidylyltransferase [Desulfobacteraceae bacterium]
MINSDLLKTVAVIPAAGSGIRMQSDRAKQFLNIEERPLLAVTLTPFQDCREVEAIILVVPSDDVKYCREEIVRRFGFTKVQKVIAGGERRQDSVRFGLEATEGKYDIVLIHDGVRPVIEKGLLRTVIKAAMTHRAVITALPAKETVKEVNDRHEVVRTYERQRVWMVQTPQAFHYQDILKAHRQAIEEGWEEATDDARLMERLGVPVKVVEGSERNIKVTTPYDLELARFLLGKR